MATATEHLTTALDEAEQSRPAPDLYAEISSIDRAGLAPRDRAGEVLRAVNEALRCLASTITVGAGGEEIDLRRAADREGLDAWIGTLQRAALEARSHARSIARLYGRDEGSPEFAVIACPIDSAGRDPFGGMAVLVRCAEIPEAERIQLHLRSACLHAAGMLAKPARARGDGIEMSDMARVFTKAGEFASLHQFAFAITNAARQRFDCDLAAMGWAERGRVRLLCVSGLDGVKRRNPGVRVIEQAMGECADALGPIVAQQKDAWGETVQADHGRLHDRWRAAAGGASVLSVPIMSGDRVVAVMSFRRPADAPFDADDIKAVQHLLAPLAGATPLVARANRGVLTHVADSCSAAAGWVFKTGSIRKRAALAAGLALAAWWVTASSPYRVSTPARVVADRERIIASPADGWVAEVLVRPGDEVSAGQLLVRLKTADLELERARLEADMAAAELRITEAVVEGSPADAAIARAEHDGMASRHRSVVEKIARSSIVAPVAGVVIGPELADLPGQTVASGQPVCSIAESGSLSLELHLPESRVADLQPGGEIRFASHSRPETPGKTTLGRVAPSSVQRDGKAVFLGEAALPADQDWLRPGMEGVAMIEIGERPNWWLVTHKALDAVRLRFWID